MELSNKAIGWIMGLMLLSFTLSAQSDTTKPQRYDLTVKEAVDLAFKNVQELRSATLDYRIQEAKNKEIAGQALPQLSGTIGANRYLQVPKFLFPQSDEGVYSVLRREHLLPSSAQAPPPSLVEFSFQQPWNMTMGATVTQLLFEPDVFVGLQARQSALDYNQALIDQTKEKIKDTAYKRYYAILVAQKALQFINESAKRLEKLYHDDSIMFKNGFAERLDLDKVQVQLNNLRNTQSVLQNAVTIGYAAMKFSIGISQKDTVVLKDDLTDEIVKEGVLEEGFKYDDRAEVRTLQVLQDLQKLDIKRNKMAALPTVALAGNYTVNGMGQQFFTDKSTTWLRSSYVGVNINIPVFSGFQRKNKVVEAKLNLEKVSSNLEYAKQGIDLEQTIARESLKTALYNLDVQDRNLALAERVYNATKTKFEQGVGSSFEVLQADTDFQTAQSNYFSALYNAVVARVSYLYSLGKL
ncbi:MAG TPA: TolC family protein [Chitinophagaceae bacterium]|nr:TolC family protein [Chitinophagaceae bacterium]